MKALKSKPNALVLFAVLALAMTGCGRNNNNNVAPLPPGGIVNGQYNYPGGVGGTPGVLPSQPFVGTVYMDSANVMTMQGPSFNCPGTESFVNPPMTNNASNSPYGQVVITGTRQGCAANITAQVILSQLAVQQIGMYLFNGAIGSVTIIGINLGRYGSTLYGGQVQLLINGSFPYTLQF